MKSNPINQLFVNRKGEGPSTADRVSVAARKYPGFTMVELLVTVAIIITLAALAFTASRSISLSANKVKDMQNLRSLSVAAMAAGGDNAGRLPTIHTDYFAPYFLQDRKILESFGISKEVCYAPTRNIYGGAPGYAWWYNYGASTPTHYVYYANDAAVKTSAWFLAGSVTPPSKGEYRGAIPYEEIIKDPTMAFARTITDDAWYPVLWSGLCRDNAGSPRVAAFMQDGEPIGINEIYLDGHAEWVPKAKMKARFNAGSLTVSW
ncbi:MAG: type II secretion system protein [Luteolibacter sp.]